MSRVAIGFILIFVALIATTQAACANNCSYPLGSCLTSWDACQCTTSAMGADCSILPSNTTTPIFTSQILGLMGQVLSQEWMIYNVSTGSGVVSYLRLRWTINSDSWFGGIFDVGWDGMTRGDSWIYYISPTSKVSYLADYYSHTRATPTIDTQQDLTLVNAWRNGIWQSVEFTRTMNANDVNDADLNSPIRFMWSTGLTPCREDGNPGPAYSWSAQIPSKLTMHGLSGWVGQYQFDFWGGSAKVLTDGVQWPLGYYAVLVFGFGALVLPFGVFLSRDCILMSRVGLCLRRRPFLVCCSRPKSSNGCRCCCPGSFIMRYFEMDQFSYQNYLFAIVYLSINVAIYYLSLFEYEAISRSWMYFFGHILAIHMALAILPAAHNSPFLWLFNIGFDVAISWHRRIGRITFILLLAHGLTQLVVWGYAPLLYSTATCQWGMGAIYGTAALLCFFIVAVTSLNCVRRRSWEWFLNCHLVFVPIGYVFALMHSINLRWLLIVPGLICLIDLVLRYTLNPYIRFGNRVRLCGIECLGPEGPGNTTLGSPQVTVLTLETDSTWNKIYLLYAHVFIRVPKIASFQMHPFTLSSAETVTSGDGATEKTLFKVHILANTSSSSSWSQQLYNVCSAYLKQNNLNKADFSTSSDGNTNSPPFSVLVDGPYSALNLPLFKFKVIVLISGGIGITPCMTLLTYFTNHRDSLRTTRMYLNWTCRGRTGLETWFPNELNRIYQNHSQSVSISLRVTGYNQDSATIPQPPKAKSRKSRQNKDRNEEEMKEIQNGSVGDDSTDNEETEEISLLPTQIPILPGRTELSEYLKMVIAECAQQGVPKHDIVVFSCGPKELIKDVEYRAERLGLHATHEAFNY